MNKKSRDEFEKYYSKLVEKLNSKEPDFELNEDRAHNATIERFMLDKSKEVNMYCGEMSVFRENFYKHINNDSRQGEDNQPEKEKLGDFLKTRLISSLSDFIDRTDTQLNIFLERVSINIV